ncbi:O-antigen ligase family protein, partial [Bilophila wadsworthia]
GRFPDIRSQYIFWNAHQMILGILCETGIAGLIIFILLIYRAIRDGIKNYPETFPALLMLVDFLIAGIGGYGFHRSWNSAFFFLAIGLIEGLRLRKNSLIRQLPAQHDQPCGAQAE